MSATLIHKGPGYELSVAINTSRYGHHLKFIPLVSTARRPEPHLQSQAGLSTAELVDIHEAIGRSLARLAVRTSSSSGEPVAG